MLCGLKYFSRAMSTLFGFVTRGNYAVALSKKCFEQENCIVYTNLLGFKIAHLAHPKTITYAPYISFLVSLLHVENVEADIRLGTQSFFITRATFGDE